MSKHSKKVRARLAKPAPIDVHHPDVAVLGMRVLEILRETYTPHGLATAGVYAAGIGITEGLDPLDKIVVTEGLDPLDKIVVTEGLDPLDKIVVAARSLGLLDSEAQP